MSTYVYIFVNFTCFAKLITYHEDLNMVKNIAVCVAIDSTRFTQTYRWTTIKAATISDRVTKEAVFSKHGTLILESCQ